MHKPLSTLDKNPWYYPPVELDNWAFVLTGLRQHAWRYVIELSRFVQWIIVIGTLTMGVVGFAMIVWGDYHLVLGSKDVTTSDWIGWPGMLGLLLIFVFLHFIVFAMVRDGIRLVVYLRKGLYE